MPFGGHRAVVASALPALRAHALAGSDARTLARCGVTAEQLVLAGVTLADLARTSSIELHDVVDALGIDERRLHALCFHPAMLTDRARVPLSALTGAASLRYDARHVLQFPVHSYKELRHGLGLEPAELAALGLDARVLVHRFALDVDALLAERTTAAWRGLVPCTLLRRLVTPAVLARVTIGQRMLLCELASARI